MGSSAGSGQDAVPKESVLSRDAAAARALCRGTLRFSRSGHSARPLYILFIFPPCSVCFGMQPRREQTAAGSWPEPLPLQTPSQRPGLARAARLEVRFSFENFPCLLSSALATHGSWSADGGHGVCPGAFHHGRMGCLGTVRGSLLVSAVSGSPYVCLYNKGVFLSVELLATS